MVVNCDNCGKECEKSRFAIRRAIRHYCSRKCAQAGRKFLFTEEQKRERQNQLARQRHKKDPAKTKARALRYQQKCKQEVLAAYGDKCACCEEPMEEFLEIDHINNDGAEHRKQTGLSGHRLYAWLRRNNWPPGFQVLCRNCNGAKWWYGKCPHGA